MSKWKISTLRTFLQRQIDDQAKAVAVALESAEKAVIKAEEAANKRFESVNEFRQQLNDQTKTFMTRDEVETRFAAVAKDIAANTSRLDRTQGRDTGRSADLITWIAIGGLILSVVSRFIWP